MFKLAEIYTKEHCPNCHEALSLLKSFKIKTHNWRLDEIGVSESDDCIVIGKEELLAKVPKARSVPQIFLDGQYIGGLNELRNKLTIEP
jgi:glutaredoxin